MSRKIKFPLLKKGLKFQNFSDFNVLFEQLKLTYNLEYRFRSTKYITNDKKIKEKSYNPNIIYSEYHVQCKGKGMNSVTGVEENCLSEVKLAPRDGYQCLEITVFCMIHNHEVTKAVNSERQIERLTVIESITQHLGKMLYQLNDEEFTQKIETLNSIINLTEYYVPENNVVETTFTEILNDTTSTVLNRTKTLETSVGQDSLANNAEQQIASKEKTSSENEQKYSTDQSLGYVELPKQSSSSVEEPTEMQEFENHYSNNTKYDDIKTRDPLNEKTIIQDDDLTDIKKETLKTLKKTTRVVKKKSIFSPSINVRKPRRQVDEKIKPNKGTSKSGKGTSNSGKKSDKAKLELQNTEKEILSNDNYKFLRNKYCQDSFDNEVASLDLNADSTLQKQKLKIKVAFNDLDRRMKRITMMKWLQISDVAMENVLRQEYILQSKDFKDPIDSFLEISKSDLSLLEKCFEEGAYASLVKSIERKRKLQWICPKCSEGEKEDACVLCESCLRWFHYHCAGIKKEPKADWFCSEITCNLSIDN